MRTWAWAAALVGSACVGPLDPAERPNDPIGPQMGSSEPSAPSDAQPDVQEGCDAPWDGIGTPIRRLTRAQLSNSLRALADVGEIPVHALPADKAGDGYLWAGAASALFVEKMADLSQGYARAAAGILGERFGCEDESCLPTLVEVLGGEAWRRPLTTEERQQLLTLATRAGPEVETSIEAVVQALVESPFFLYHLELPPAEAVPGEVFALDDLALANRLSYFLWASPPDAPLVEAARAGRLRTNEGLREQALRMLDDQRAQVGFRNFYRDWLGLASLDALTKSEALYPDFDATTAADLRASLEAWLDDLFVRDASLQEMFTSSKVFLNARLAELLDLDISGLSETLTAVELDSSRRSGLLTQPALLALLAKPDETDPIHRGAIIRERFLCQLLPEFPENLEEAVPPPADGTKTTRQRYETQLTEPACSGCHQLFNPIGFAFEHYDPVGAWRDTDNGLPVDATSDVVATRDLDGIYPDAVALLRSMSESFEVQGCLLRHLYRYALQRSDKTSDQCRLDAMTRQLRAKGLTLRSVMVSVATSEAFRLQELPQ